MRVNTNILSVNDLVVAFSGGPDSLALLHYLHHNTDIELHAVHVNHNLQLDHCLNWAKVCYDFCRNLGIKISIYDVYPGKSSNVENSLRDLRYGALKTFGTDIVTGHHKDDQIETFFLKLLRGSGVKGLKGIEWVSNREGMTVYRPLLESTKEEILEYCNKHKLLYITDPSNDTNDFARNIIRNEVLPVIGKHFESFKSAIGRSIFALQDADLCLEELAKIDLRSVSVGDKISIEKIRQNNLSPHRIRNMIMYYFKELELTANVNHLIHFSETLLTISYNGELELLGMNQKKEKKKLKQRGKHLILMEW